MVDVKPSNFTQAAPTSSSADFIPYTLDKTGTPLDRTMSVQQLWNSFNLLTTETDLDDAADEILIWDNSNSDSRNITIDNLFKGIHDMFIPASAMWESTTSGCAALTKTELASGQDIQTLDFDGVSVESAQFDMQLPRNYDLSTITYTVHWTGAAGAGGVTWGLEAYAVSNDGALAGTYGTRIDVDDTFLAANDEHLSPESTALTINGTPASQDFIKFKVTRQTADANDTKSEDAKLLGITIHVGVNKKSSA